MKTLIPVSILLLALLAADASAEFSALCDNANPCTVSGEAIIGADSTVQLVWRGRVRFHGHHEPVPGNGGVPGAHAMPVTVVSEGGIFMAGEMQLGAVNVPLSSSVNPPHNEGDVPFMFMESVQVPGAVSQQAASMGVNELRFVRTFHTSTGDIAAAIQVIQLRQPPTSPPPPPPDLDPGPGPGSGPGPDPGLDPDPEPGPGPTLSATSLRITQMLLRFDSGELTRTLDIDEQDRVVAHLVYNRNGMLDAVWEVATPPSTRGQPVFVPVEHIRQYLGAGREAQLRSPALPSARPGLYMVRLRLLQPHSDQASPVLRYNVAQRAGAETARVARLAVSRPDAAAVLDGETRFRWRDHPGAIAYQLEFYPSGEPEEQLLAGLLLPAGTSETVLSRAVISHLAPGQVYRWRVVAIDGEGAIMAASEWREIRAAEP